MLFYNFIGRRWKTVVMLKKRLLCTKCRHVVKRTNRHKVYGTFVLCDDCDKRREEDLKRIWCAVCRQSTTLDNVRLVVCDEGCGERLCCKICASIDQCKDCGTRYCRECKNNFHCEQCNEIKCPKCHANMCPNCDCVV